MTRFPTLNFTVAVCLAILWLVFFMYFVNLREAKSVLQI